MDKWVLYGADYVDALARHDPDYQKLLAQHELLVPKFDALMATLPWQQRELVLEYLNLALDLEYQKTRIAYSIQ